MAQNAISEGRRIIMMAASLIIICIMTLSCAAPAYAKVDPGWGAEGTYTQEQTQAQTQDNTSPSENPDGSGGNENTGTVTDDNSNDNTDKSDDRTSAEQGFTTPGNGNLGDQIRNSGGKDFYTVHTKNNNTFYLVIDHANSTENVYMLSLIDENDLAEFLEEKQTDESKTSAPVIIPETKPQVETTEAEKKQEREASGTPGQSNMILIILLVAGIGGAAYYFMIYRPGHEEDEEDTSEGLEGMGDGLPTENEG